jgi:hypothetical protein
MNPRLARDVIEKKHKFKKLTGRLEEQGRGGVSASYQKLAL